MEWNLNLPPQKKIRKALRVKKWNPELFFWGEWLFGRVFEWKSGDSVEIGNHCWLCEKVSLKTAGPNKNHCCSDQ